ncbi:FAD dependent oxidoreductase-domain-containing protein [Aspergillus lucknowensis]|uniref:FAD dependent oxidoreductase-domain-containing protein n=1 Tax=Aspergillus lucknowensis TaxID=176173 RepID=A0ABR4M447_9EURO
MAEPPAKRARRVDSSTMWDTEERKTRSPEVDSERDNNSRRDPHFDDKRRDEPRDDRRYRSRSRDRREKRRERSRSRDHRDRDRDRDRRDRDRDGRDTRKRDRSDSRERYADRRGYPSKSDRYRDRSRSPLRNGTRERTPPLGSRGDRRNDRRDYRDRPNGLPESKSRVDRGRRDMEMDIDDADGEDDIEELMRRSMGFSKFRSTKNTKVPGNNIYGVRKEKKTEYRQYMNRTGGFNRPLSGGIIGCCSAYFLTRHPFFDPSRHSITLIEASDIAGGASGKAGGLLALWAYPSSIVPLSYKLHAELAKEHNGKDRWGYREVGCAQLVAQGRQLNGKNDAGDGAGGSVSLQKRSAAAISKLKTAKMPQELDWIEPDLVRSYESMSDPGETAQVHPFLFTTAIAKLAEEKGAKITLGSVTGIDYSGGTVESVTYIEKETGQPQTIPATDVVVAAGPWTSAVMPEAPISAMRAHSVVIRPTKPASAHTLFTNIEIPANFDPSKPSRPTVATPEIYARPDDTVYACGEGDHIVPLPSTTADVEVDQQRCQDVINQVGAISDALRDGDVVARQACYLPNVSAVRGGPLIGPTGTKGLYLAAGHTCWGIQNAPGTGKLISEFVFDGRAKSANIGALDPRNFL